MKYTKYLFIAALILSLVSCGGEKKAEATPKEKKEMAKKSKQNKQKEAAAKKNQAKNNKAKKAGNKNNQNKDLFFQELSAATGISEADYKQIKSLDGTFRKDLKSAKNAAEKKAARTKKDTALKSLLGNNYAKYKKLNTDWSNAISTVRLKSKLSLTDDQLAQLKPISKEYGQQLKKLNKKKNAAKYSKLAKELETKSLAVLTTDQKSSYDKILAGIKKNQRDRLIPFQ